MVNVPTNQILTSHIFTIIFINVISRFLLQYKFVSLGHHASILKARIQLQRCEYQRFFHPFSSYQACSRVSVDLCIQSFLLNVWYCWLKKPLFFSTSYHVFDLVGPIHCWMTQGSFSKLSTNLFLWTIYLFFWREFKVSLPFGKGSKTPVTIVSKNTIPNIFAKKKTLILGLINEIFPFKIIWLLLF